MSENGSPSTNTGRIIEIKGVVIDAVFPDSLPEIYTALRIEIAEQDGSTRDADRGGAAAPRRRSRPRRRDGLDRRPPARRGLRGHRGPDLRARRRADARPALERHRRADRRAGPTSRTTSSAGRSTATRRPSATSRRRSRSSRRGSRSSTSSRRSSRAARSASSAARGSARPCSSRSSSTTSRMQHGGVSVFAGVGERSREGNDLWREMEESGVIDKVALVFGQMNEPPGARLRVGLSGLTMAEYFRDEGQDVLLFIDNIFRFVQAGSEVSALLGRMPSAVGYQPTLATEMGQLQERITSTRTGSVTSVQAIYVPADDLTDPAPANTFAHLDAFITLSRLDRREGHLPGRRPARLVLARAPAGASSRTSTTRPRPTLQQILQRYKDLQDIIAILGMDELTDEDKLVVGARAPDRALPLAAELRRRAVHRHAGQVREARGHDPRLPGDHRRASTTSCPSRRSTWSARSRTRSRRRAQAEAVAA